MYFFCTETLSVQDVHWIYCARGDIEHRIKELLDGLQIEPHDLLALLGQSPVRVLLTAAPYVLLQARRLRAARTACARAQVTWLRARLLTLGVHVVGSVRRAGARRRGRCNDTALLPFH